MNQNDKMWLERCKEHPEQYKIWVDNDCVCVEELGGEYDSIHTFRSYGYEFALELLIYMGCNADLV